MTYVDAMNANDLWDGEMRRVTVNGLALLLVKLEGEIFAYEDRCSHLKVPLSEGRLEGGELVCAAHHWRYDARTGRGVNPTRVCVRRYDVRVDCGKILVDVGATNSVAKAAAVGPVLLAGDAAGVIIAAIKERNSEVSVVDRGSYLRVSSPHHCVLQRHAVERLSGKAFRLPRDLEVVMMSFCGKLSISEEEATWTSIVAM